MAVSDQDNTLADLALALLPLFARPATIVRVTLCRVTCPTCGMEFAVPLAFLDLCKSAATAGKDRVFHCPQGHGMKYPKARGKKGKRHGQK